MAAKGIMEIRPNIPFGILVANLTNILVHVRKHMVHSVSRDSMVDIIDSENVKKERCRTVATSHATSKPPASIGECANTPTKNKDWRNRRNIFSEYAPYHIRFINMLEQFQGMWDAHLGEPSAATCRVESSSPEARRIYVVPYPAGPKSRKIEEEKIGNMLETKVAEPTQTEWALSIVLDPKQDGNSRLLVDSRKLNAGITGDSYCLPQIDESIILLEMTRYSQHFTQIGLFAYGSA